MVRQCGESFARNLCKVTAHGLEIRCEQNLATKTNGLCDICSDSQLAGSQTDHPAGLLTGSAETYPGTASGRRTTGGRGSGTRWRVMGCEEQSVSYTTRDTNCVYAAFFFREL
jgi:hypothetical protein